MTLFTAILSILLAGDMPATLVRATVWVRAGDRATGTGWVVDADRRWVVTAAHVVGDRERVEVCFVDRCLNHSITDRPHYVANREALYRRGLVATARVIARRDNADVVLLALDRLPPGTPALPLTDRPARTGEACQSVGHRHDAELMWNLSAGRVRQAGRLPAGYFSGGRRIAADVPLVLLQSPIEAGESGAAVVNTDGHVIGIVSAVVNQTPGLALAIDVSEVRSLLSGAADSPPRALVRADDAGLSLADRLSAATMWVRPQSTNGRAAGVLIDRERRLVLTSATAVGSETVVDVVVPQWFGDRLLAEADVYSDRLGLRLSRRCVAGVVLARDSARDLAIVELDTVPVQLLPIRLAARGPRMGDAVASMSHPAGIDLLWLYAAGNVRSIGEVALAREPVGGGPKVRAVLLQLPHQGSASGGPVVNEAGELIGLLAARDAARQDLAYAATTNEIRSLLVSSRSLWEPTSSSEWIARGRLAMKTDRPAKATEAFRAAMVLSPNEPIALAGAATAMMARAHTPEAVGLADTALGKKPNPETLAELALVFLQAGQSKSAAELVDRALKMDPRCALAYVARARLRSGNDAQEDIAEALFIDPNCAPAYRVRARMANASKDGHRQALADWSRVLELQPTDAESLSECARLFTALRDPKKAVGDWTRLT